MEEDKTKFTLEHAKIFFQTFAEIEAEIHAPNVEVTAIVKECDHKWITKKNTKEQRQS